MYSLLISIGAALAVLLITKFAFDLSWIIAIIPAMLVLMAVYFLLAKYIMKKVMAVMEAANRDLQAQRIDKAIRELQAGFKYGKWQFYVTGQINSQIGIIYYVKRDFSAAFPYLQKSFARNWVALGMLAITYMKRNKKEKMVETFEKAVRWSSKESLIWSLYAYCMNESGETEKAKGILDQALKKIPADERLANNLNALNDGKKMKMRNYGDMWLQFHLEKQSAVMKQQAAAMGGMAKKRVIRK